MKMVCPWRPLNSGDVLFRWSGERLSLLTLSACFSGTSKGYGLVKYASKASSIQARHVLEGYHFCWCARKYLRSIFLVKTPQFDFSLFDFRCALNFSRQNTTVWFFAIRLPVRAQINSIFLVKTQQFWFFMIRLPARSQIRSIFLVKTQHFDFS